jgi:hypothetical protein
MNPVLQRLNERNPEGPIGVGDDDLIREFLLHEGILHKVIPPEGKNFAAHFWHTDTHWYFVIYHRGHVRPQDNGYFLFLMPRQYIDEPTAREFFSDALEASGIHGHVTLRPFDQHEATIVN